MEQNRQNLTKRQKDFITIYNSKLGIVSIACESANLSRAMYYRWLNENYLFKEKIDEAEEKLKDFGEMALLKSMQKGDVASIIFFNKTKNKDRGYIERPQFEINNTIIDKQMNISFPQIMEMIDGLENEQKT